MTDVALRFGATDDRLTAQFRRVSQQLTGFEREASRVGKAASTAFRGLGDELGRFAKIATAAFAVKQVLDFADGIDKAAKQTGIAVESLQRLQFIAGQVGTSTDSITRSVNRLQVTLVEAGEGSAQAADALAKLGIPVEQFIALAPDRQFERVAREIAAIENPTQRAATAIGLFGRGGAELLPVLTQTGVQLADIQAKFSGFGGPVSTVAIERVDELGDSFANLKGNAVSLGTELLALVSGPLTATVDGINTLLGSARLLAGGGGELERLQNKLRLLQDERDTIPIYFNLFGYVDGAPVLMNATDLDKAIGDLRAKIEAQQSLPDVGGPSRGPSTRRGRLRDLGDVDGAPKTNAAVAAQPIAARALTPEELRAKADAEGAQSPDFITNQYRLAEVANQAHIDELVRQWGAFAEIRVDQASVMGSALAELREQYGVQEIKFEELKAASIQDIQASIATSGLQIATALFGQNKKVALAVAAINIGVGATEALKLPFPANLAAVAKVLAQGAQLTARIRSASIGGGAGFGGAVGGGVASGAEPLAAAEPTGATSNAATTIYINGFISRNTIDDLVSVLRDEVDRDVTIIGGNSRQAFDLQG